MRFIVLILILLSVALTHALPYILELSSPVSTFISQSIDSTIGIRQVYDSDLFNGLSVDFKSKERANQFILENKKIIKAWTVHHHFTIQGSSKDNHAIMFVPQSKDTLYQLTRENYMYRDLNLDGSGIKVGIIDSGVDYTHPALGGCFGKGCKVAYGYDLVGNNFDGSMKSIQPGPDPIDNCPPNSSKDLNWTGVAPGVTLGMWKVYSCNYATVPNDILMKAVEMAYKAGMDIINLSLGIHGGWEEEALAEMAHRVVAKGVHVVAANGNIGPNGIFLPASPASGKGVIAVGSIMNRHVPGYVLKVFSKSTFTIIYRTFTNTPLRLEKELPVVSSSKMFNKKNDACAPLKGKAMKSIMLIHQGGCNILDQIKYAKQAGAQVALFYSDTTNGTTDIEVLPTATLPVAFINNADGYQIHSALKGTNAEFTQTLVVMDAPKNDLIHAVSGFSSQGPTNELQLKPEIMGVGGNVFSTLPRYLKSFGFRSGTSMATPFVSGQIALILQKKKVNPKQLKNLLMNFATQVEPPIPEFQYGDSPIRQGAGVISAASVLKGIDLFRASPSYLGFNDSSHFAEYQEITFYNHQSQPLTLYLSHRPSLTATGYTLNSSAPSEPVGLSSQFVATIKFSTTTLTLPGGQSAKVSLQLKPPTLSYHALYGGYIVASTFSSNLSIPYLGMTGRMKDLPILDRCDAKNPTGYPFPTIGSPNTNTTVTKGHSINFTLQKNIPVLLVRLLTGTRILQIQVKQGSQILGDVPHNDQEIPRVWLMRNTLDFTEYSSSFYSWQWQGDYLPVNATLWSTDAVEPIKHVGSGTYQLKLRALKIFGDMEKQDDWEEWISPEFVLNCEVMK